MKKYLEIILNIKTHHLQQKIYLKQTKTKTIKLKRLIINELIDIDIKEILEIENPKVGVNIVEKILIFNSMN